MIKKAFFSIILFITPLALSAGSVSVEDATAAYGRLNVSLSAFIASVKAATKTQEGINKDLEKQIKASRGLVLATVRNIDKVKNLNYTSSSFVDYTIATSTNMFLENEIDLLHSKNLDNIMTKDDLKHIGANR